MHRSRGWHVSIVQKGAVIFFFFGHKYIISPELVANVGLALKIKKYIKI